MINSKIEVRKQLADSEINQELIAFLRQFEAIQEDDLDSIAKAIPVVNYKKGTYLVQHGEIPDACYFVLKGLVRQGKIVDGNEKTIAFYSEENGAVTSSDFVEQTPFSGFLVCAEDVTLIRGSRDLNAENLDRFPVLRQIVAKMLENDLNKTRDQFQAFIISTPEERYLSLIEEHPDLVNRVPLHQIASLLGITAESLSRIRKRIVTKK